MRKEKWTIRSAQSGAVIAEVVVEAEEIPVATAQTHETTRSSVNGAGEKMSEPQRRYLFRLLAAQKVTGKEAEKHLRDYFKVATIADITRQGASEYIDQLVKDRKDGGA